jgi:hypothetical protein
MNAKAISFTPDVLKAKLRALEEYGACQTRRPLHGTVAANQWPASERPDGRIWVDPAHEYGWAKPPFGVAGQRLWVRERARVLAAHGGVIHTSITTSVTLEYALDGVRRDVAWPERLTVPTVGHCIHNGVHREGARHFLEVVEMRVERLHNITEEDAGREGFDRRLHFLKAFETIYGEAFALSDPWCWVYTLKRVEP